MMMCCARNDKQLPLGCAKSRDPFAVSLPRFSFLSSPAVALVVFFFFSFLLLYRPPFSYFNVFGVEREREREKLLSSYGLFLAIVYTRCRMTAGASNLLSYITSPHTPKQTDTHHVHNSILCAFLFLPSILDSTSSFSSSFF